ncbi:MAG: circularly permuted type 2 ATP-grasp protein [Pseudomonadota bacterium]
MSDVPANTAPTFDEMHDPDGSCRSAYQAYNTWLSSTEHEVLGRRQQEAELLFRRIGITFAVYGDDRAQERIIPFDIVPRIITSKEWSILETGLTQRVQALNLFLKDLYFDQRVIKDGIVPIDLVFQNPAFRPEMKGLAVAQDIYSHISGIDIVRVDPETFYVLEDNVRTPSGVSYMLENREVMMRLFPDLFSSVSVAPVEQYTDDLLATLQSVAPKGGSRSPNIIVLTPGPFNSAYYEHTFLADKLGVEVVEGRDLLVRDDVVYMRTTEGLQRVDVIYRRVDDDFLDPLVFRSDSVIGVPGLLSAYRAGNVTITNAIGTGVADDKAIYTYVPELIRYYLDQDPILHNVPTYRCREASELSHVLDNLDELVVKEVHGSGGYGMLVGPKASAAEIDTFRDKLKANPDGFIAQPTLALSTCPTLVEEGLAPRHVDLRPFILSGADKVRIAPGGLTRVALREGSLVVNSSQGGGTKDTWVLHD